VTESAPTRSTLWPLVLSIGLAVIGGGAVIGWGVTALLTGESPIGDGRDPATYGVDLSDAALPAGAIVASGNPRDFLMPYEQPGTLPGGEVAAWNAEHARKWQKEVVSTDRVVGVSIGGEHRAYPLFIVDAHEIVLDELGGVPIVVARSPLVDEVMVFERGVDERFGVSGLLGDLTLLMHDAVDVTASPSLVSAGDGRAVAGPRARGRERLTPISGVSVVRWRDWLAAHPDTTVVVRDPGSMQRYRRISYDRYLDGDAWIIPPRSIPPVGEEAPGARDIVISVLDGDGTLLAVLPVSELRAAAVRDRVRIEIEGRTLELQPDPALDATLVVESNGLVTRQGMWIGVWLQDPDAAEKALAEGSRLRREQESR
jgi:hypothetical protein